MPFSEWIVAFLIVCLPPEFEQVRLDSQEREGRIPGLMVRETSAHWSSEGKDLYLFLYEPYPDRDGGPMVEAESWPVSLLGQSTKLIETSLFFGSTKRVLVAHRGLAEPESQLMIYSPNLEREEFETILGLVRFDPRSGFDSADSK